MRHVNALHTSQGSVGPAEVYTFSREIHEMWVKMGEYADLAIYDVVDELIDMVRGRVGGKSVVLVDCMKRRHISGFISGSHLII